MVVPLALRRRSPAGRRFAAAGRPGTRLDWREARFCALDLELTGLDPVADNIIAVGLVPIAGGRAQLGVARYSLVASERRSHPTAVLTHRLRDADLAGAPPLSQVRELILDGFAGAVPVFHHAAVETAFLSRAGIRVPPAVDTEQLARRYLAQQGAETPVSLSLTALSAQLGQVAEPAHHALGDALTTAQAFIALASLLSQPQTIGSLLQASIRARD